VSELGELRWMLPPLAMCLVLTGIHGYLGLHVLSRKVIFVDLALAQIAALGSVYAVLLGYDPRADEGIVYFFSLGFTFVGAAVFSLTRMRHERVPQEAFIGIVYATASAVALLLLSKASGEAEHIKEMLVGNVLLVTWPHIARTAVLYAAIGAFHWFFREPFLEISTDPEAALARGRRVRLWDFLFYASFGVVITTSVQVAGVLLVFSFLVVPAVIAFMYAEATGPRIALAWATGTACSAAGMLVSYHGDLPTGPSVVACFAAVLVLAALVYYVRGAERWGAALARVVVGLLVVGAVLALGSQLRRRAEVHAHGDEYEALSAELASPDENAQIEAVHHLARLGDAHGADLLAAALAEPQRSDRVIEHIVQALPDFGAAAARAVPAIEALAARHEDPYIRLEAAEALLRLRSASGFELIRRLLEDEAPAMVAEKASALVKKMAGLDLNLRDAAARATFASWVEKNRGRLRWRPDRERFE
jgi:zinc/manganese transport system permease protein